MIPLAIVLPSCTIILFHSAISRGLIGAPGRPPSTLRVLFVWPDEASEKATALESFDGGVSGQSRWHQLVARDANLAPGERQSVAMCLHTVQHGDRVLIPIATASGLSDFAQRRPTDVVGCDALGRALPTPENALPDTACLGRACQGAQTPYPG